MRALFIYCVLAISCTITKTISRNNENFSKIMEVHIHEKYNNDTISIQNKDCVLLKNEVIKTRGILPNTGIYLVVYQMSKKKYSFEIHRYQYVDTIYCNDNLDISFLVNGKKQNIEIKKPLAPYVGVGRQDDSLTILLSDKMFQYD